MEARSKATSIQLSADDLTPENIQKFQAAQAQLSGALSRLLAVAESYPDLKTNAQFGELMNELERTENRINIARRITTNLYKSITHKCVHSLPILRQGFF